MYPPGHYNHPYNQANASFNSNGGFNQQTNQWHFNGGTGFQQQGAAASAASQNSGFYNQTNSYQYQGQYHGQPQPQAHQQGSNSNMQQWNNAGWNYPGYNNAGAGAGGEANAYQRTLEYVQQCQSWNTSNSSANPPPPQ